jgi:hypothetical protein
MAVSTSNPIPDPTETDDSTDPWESAAEHQETLEMLVEEETAWASYARRLLDGLAKRGYR